MYSSLETFTSRCSRADSSSVSGSCRMRAFMAARSPRSFFSFSPTATMDGCCSA